MNKCVTLLLLLLPLYTARAQTSAISLSLPESEKQFIDRNLVLIAERYNIDIAEAQFRQAKLIENPVVSFDQNVYNRLNSKYFDFGSNGQSAVDLDQLIYIAGQRNNRIRLEKINKEMSVYQFEEVLRTLRHELRTKFVELYYARKSSGVYEREITSLKQLLNAFKEQQEKGNISLLEKSRIQALLLSLQQEQNEIANQILSLESNLKFLLALKPTDTFEPLFDESILMKIDLSAISFADLCNRIVVRPDLKMAETGVRVSEANVKLQKSLAFPEVHVTGSYDKAGNFINNYFSVGLNFTLPVFNRNQGQIKAARIAFLQNSNREQQALEQAKHELYASYARLDKAISLYHSADIDMEHDFETLINGMNENFHKRNISLLEFVDYYCTYKETCLQLFQTRKEVLLAMEDLNTVTGSEIFNY